MKLPILIGAICLVGLAVVLYIRFYRRYLGIGREGSYLLAIGTIAAAIAPLVIQRMRMVPQPVWANGGGYGARNEIHTQVIWTGLLVLAGVPLAVKLYRSWIGGHVTEQEKATGTAGVRAWLAPVNLLLALVASISAMEGFGYSFWGVFSLALLALLAYPGLSLLSQAEPSALPVETSANLTAEREKVLALLEAGKITAEESAELLNALGSTLRAPEPKGAVFAPEHRTMLIGAALVLIGFFLPWFTIDLGKELQRVAGQVEGQMNQFAPGMNGLMGQMQNGTGPFNFQMGSINVTGGDVQHGLGWLVLLLSLGTAVLPLVAGHIDPQTRRTISMLALGAGALIVVYLLTSNLRFLNVGIVLVAAGYFAQWVCLLRRGGASHVVPGVIGEHA